MASSFLMNGKALLKKGNGGKRYHPYRTLSAFITFLAKLRTIYSIPFRSLDGIERILSRILNPVCEYPFVTFP